MVAGAVVPEVEGTGEVAGAVASEGAGQVERTGDFAGAVEGTGECSRTDGSPLKSIGEMACAVEGDMTGTIEGAVDGKSVVDGARQHAAGVAIVLEDVVAVAGDAGHIGSGEAAGEVPGEVEGEVAGVLEGEGPVAGRGAGACAVENANQVYSLGTGARF
jgi:hypothetical protein